MSKRLSALTALFFCVPALGTISNIQHVTGKGTSVTTSTGISLTITSSGAGNLLVADCNIRDNTTAGDTVAVSDNQSQIWVTPAISSGASTNIYSMFSFYLLSTVSGVTTVTFKPSGGGGSPYTSMICDVAEYSTTTSGFVFDAGNFNAASTASNTESASVTTTKTNDLVYGAVQNSNGDTGTALTGFTNLDSSSQNGVHQNQHQLNIAAGSYTSGQDSIGISNAQLYAATVVSFGEVASAAPASFGTINNPVPGGL